MTEVNLFWGIILHFLFKWPGCLIKISGNVRVVVLYQFKNYEEDYSYLINLFNQQTLFCVQTFLDPQLSISSNALASQYSLCLSCKKSKVCHFCVSVLLQIYYNVITIFLMSSSILKSTNIFLLTLGIFPSCDYKSAELKGLF